MYHKQFLGDSWSVIRLQLSLGSNTDLIIHRLLQHSYHLCWRLRRKTHAQQDEAPTTTNGDVSCVR